MYHRDSHARFAFAIAHLALWCNDIVLCMVLLLAFIGK